MEIKRFEKEYMAITKKIIQEELNKVGIEHGIILELGKTRFNDFSFAVLQAITNKIEACIFRDQKETEEEDKKEFEKLCSYEIF